MQTQSAVETQKPKRKRKRHQITCNCRCARYPHREGSIESCEANQVEQAVSYRHAGYIYNGRDAIDNWLDDPRRGLRH